MKIKKFKEFKEKNTTEPDIQGVPFFNPHRSFSIEPGSNNRDDGAGVANYDEPHPKQPSPPPFSHTNKKTVYKRAFDQYASKKNKKKNKKFSRNDLPAYDKERELKPNKYATSEPSNQLQYYKINNPH